jgi:cytidyltransferase-like protein
VTPIVDLIEDNDAEAAIYGAVLMHATRMLGNQVLRGLTSPMGDVMGHEGIVMRDDKLFGPSPVKITGEFIVGNIGGGFGQVNEEEEELEIVDQDESNPPVTKVGLKTIAVVPGAFKPPHQGHADMVRKYASMADEVIVLISKPLKKGRYLPNGKEITSSDSLKIWNLLIGDLPNVSVEIASHASPLTAAYEYIGEDGPLEPGTKVILGCSEKGCDWKRWTSAEKYVKRGVELISPRESAVEPTMRASGEPYSATDFRELLGDAQNNVVELEDFIGKGNVPALLDILGLGAEEPLEEMSSSAGGAVGGYSGPLASTSDEPGKRDKRKKKKNENIDMSLVNEVFELLIERGIIL